MKLANLLLGTLLAGNIWSAEAAGETGRPGILNVMDFGAKGDGRTDDTKAIQAAINHAAKRGGGKIFFPYTRTGYRIGSPAKEFLDGKPLRSQLYIPAGFRHNIQLEGEMPCRMLYSYHLGPNSRFYGKTEGFNTFLFSDWDAPEEHDPLKRPWTILSAPEGILLEGKFSIGMFSIRNLEFRVAMNREKMYPTQGGVNLQNSARVNIQDSQFCLNENIGDYALKKELQPNPCHTVGLMTSGDQNDNNVLRNVAVQGFRYGFVFGEHVIAEYLYVHNCEEAIVFHDSSHISSLQNVVAQHNTNILTTTRVELFGHKKGVCAVIIGSLNIETGIGGSRPRCNHLKYGVYDPENRLIGSLKWFIPLWQKNHDVFPVKGAVKYKISYL